MLKLLDTTEKLFKPEEAERVAAEMKKSDPDWDYVAKHDLSGTGYSFIEIYQNSP